MIGIIACAGKSTRLMPCTNFLSKQLLPLYDKPLIYYPISMLMKVGIKDIYIVVNSENFDLYQKQLGDGKDWGININIVLDKDIKGTIGAFCKCLEYVKGQKVCFVLGDNFFYGKEFEKQLENAVNNPNGAYVFGYPVKNPKAFGVASFDKQGNVTKLVEKPQNPESNMCVTGIYVYDEKCYDFAQKVELSERGEYEVTDLNNMYLNKQELKLCKVPKKDFWLDAGTSETLLKASNFVCKTIKKTKKQIGCIDEIAYQKGFITKEQLQKNYERLKKTSYGQYLYYNYLKDWNENKKGTSLKFLFYGVISGIWTHGLKSHNLAR